jgi:hypothetical protein
MTEPIEGVDSKTMSIVGNVDRTGIGVQHGRAAIVEEPAQASRGRAGGR